MNDNIFEALAAPFPPDKVSWRVGSTSPDKTKGMALAYIDARDVMERLDAVCGPAGWERRHPHVDKTTTCEIAIWIEERGWVVKSDGAGDTAVEAEKGSLSDSFKRAAVNWGIGRYLYDLKSPWVALDQHKKIKAEELPKLRALLSRDAPRAAPVASPPTGNEPPPMDPQEPGRRKTAAQAKRDGDDVKIKAQVAKLDRAGVADFHANFDRYTAHLPTSWSTPIHDMLESRLIDLNGAANVREAEAEMDEGFRGAVGAGAGGSSGVARNGSPVAA
jgi:hypothetical protein